MSKPENPIAFPSQDLGPSDLNAGMTLRDYFAAKAMQSLLVDTRTDKEAIVSVMQWKDGRYGVARMAYEIADAMLEARMKP